MSYNYAEGYTSLALHRIVTSFDPRNTSNLIILSILSESASKTKNELLNELIISELARTNDVIPIALSIPFKMIAHDINIAWINVIFGMVFNERMYYSFYGEYKEMLEGVIRSDLPASKDSLIYRIAGTGESIFHIAGKMRLTRNLSQASTLSVGQKIKALDTELNYIISCYESLGELFDNGNKFTITYIKDYSGTYLIDYLNKFADDLVSTSITF